MFGRRFKKTIPTAAVSPEVQPRNRDGRTRSRESAEGCLWATSATRQHGGHASGCRCDDLAHLRTREFRFQLRDPGPRTSSPSHVPGIKTTRPSRRARPSPPYTSFSMRQVIVSFRWRADAFMKQVRRRVSGVAARRMRTRANVPGCNPGARGRKSRSVLPGERPDQRAALRRLVPSTSTS